ncbi:unnamed protein product [Didymodactylos carnosus]|uniref:Uncharacterized protein n=1 Tax=Didymodactylos carnosus TaxID=1234261 RepID=A0A814X173_9BILA|nr:unnamed protein product [Didymodactylos carnosus]CAF3972258.1 unnamed protein product [Didymodactylos carnosus]
MFWLVLSVVFGIISYLVYKIIVKFVKSDVNEKKYDHAIIIGGSIGGLISAAYLSKYFKRITIFESDDVLNDQLMKATSDEILDYRCRLESASSLGRRGVKQIYQLHVLGGEGIKIIFECFPNLKDKLLNEYGARIISLNNEYRMTICGNLLNEHLTKEMNWIGVDRFTLETLMRRELCTKCPSQVEWKSRTRVTKLLVDESKNVVNGVKYRYREKEIDQSKQSVDSRFELYGDFIIDCTGRRSKSVRWLQESLHLVIPMEKINFGIGYVTFIGERFNTGNPLLDSKHVLGNVAYAPHYNKALIMTPIRKIQTMDTNSLGTLSTIVVYGLNSEYPPNDTYENLLEWVKEYLDPDYYLILKSTKVLSPLVPFRHAFDNRKYVESCGKQWPKNYILLGDSMCTFNPQYGQGITHACRHARELSNIFQEDKYKLKDISYIYNRRASSITEECWIMSTTNDRLTPALKIIKKDKYGKIQVHQRGGDARSSRNYAQPKTPIMLQFLQWYNYWFLKCASKSGELTTDFLCVVNQEKSPSTLMKPKTLVRVIHMVVTNYFNSRRTIQD